MEIVTDQSEQLLPEMLSQMENDPQNWMSLHINISPLHSRILNRDGLSTESLARIHQISVELAKKLIELGLDPLEGKIMVFEDTDVLALFLKKADSIDLILEKIRKEFVKSGLIDILKIEDMDERLSDLIVFSEEKNKTAEDYRIKKIAVKMAENISNWQPPSQDVILSVQKKRNTRKSGCVLVIEDDVLMRGLLVNMLKDKCQVVQAKNAEAGIISYMDNAPNVVLLDINMPGLNGHETLKCLKSIDPDAYVVMLSGSSTADNVMSTKYNGAAGFLCKPLHKEKLYEHIRQGFLLSEDAAKKNSDNENSLQKMI